MSAGRSQGYPMMARAADGHGTSGKGTDSPVSTDGSPEEAERRQQILAILEQGDRDIAAGNGSDWSEVKRRVRERLAARAR